VEAQTKFKLKHKLNFPLLADTEFEVIEAFGARRMKSFLGKSFLGIVRMSYWIGPDGLIRKIWDNVTPKEHAAEVLAAIRGE
jgi:peroxiredoxin Q/BCP